MPQLQDRPLAAVATARAAWVRGSATAASSGRARRRGDVERHEDDGAGRSRSDAGPDEPTPHSTRGCWGATLGLEEGGAELHDPCLYREPIYRQAID